jgi:hypothetical protein
MRNKTDQTMMPSLLEDTNSEQSLMGQGNKHPLFVSQNQATISYIYSWTQTANSKQQFTN